MGNYVYMVRSAWYESYHVYGIYRTLEAARKALSAYVKEQAKVGLTTFKWLDKNTVGEYYYSDYEESDVQEDEYKIVRVPLDKWRDVLDKEWK